MTFVPLSIVACSRDFDDLFHLTDKSKKVDGGYTPYIWKAPKAHFFKGCDTTKVFPLSINLYLKICSDEELSHLLGKKHFLRINMYYDNQEWSVSCISVMNLTIGDLKDQDIKNYYHRVRKR